MKVKVYEIEPYEGAEKCCEINLDVVVDGWLQDAQPGDEIKIRVFEMEESELDELIARKARNQARQELNDYAKTIYNLPNKIAKHLYIISNYNMLSMFYSPDVKKQKEEAIENRAKEIANELYEQIFNKIKFKKRSNNNE